MSGNKSLSIEFDKSSGAPLLSSKFYLEHIETLEVKLNVYGSESHTARLTIDGFDTKAISTATSSSMANLSLVNTEEVNQIMESAKVVLESQDMFMLKVPSGTKFGTSLPMDTGIKVELYLVPEELYSQIVSSGANTPKRRLLILDMSQPYQWNSPNESIDMMELSRVPLLRFSLSSIVSQQSEALAPAESPGDDLDDYQGHPSILYYQGYWNEKYLAYIVDATAQEGDYYGLLVVSYDGDKTITEFNLQVLPYEPFKGVTESYLDVVLSFPEFAISPYPGGKTSLALDIRIALSFICQVDMKTFVSSVSSK